ncbi:MAG TPA: hypothetical protein VMG12_06180 [Polyangiaceae bacterium]|nr:hypothetical protein [Polyangiaceae bacterium]
MRGPSRRPSSYEPGPASLRPPPEVIVPLRNAPNDIPPVTRVRTTLILSSRRALTERGLFERYCERLSPADRTSLENIIAGRWVSIDAALSHYRAVDALALPTSEQVALGGAVGEQIQSTLMATLLRMAQGLGLTPWTSVNQYARIWDRLFIGGDLLVEKLGEREAAVTMYNLSLLEVPYFRVALRGLQEAGLSAIYSWKRIHVVEVGVMGLSVKYRLTWV